MSVVSVSTCTVLFWLLCRANCANMITGLILWCIIVLLCFRFSSRVCIQGTPRTFVRVSTLCFVYMFVWSLSPCLYMAQYNWGNKKSYYPFLRLFPDPSHNITVTLEL
jgi:hypothetical protein